MSVKGNENDFHWGLGFCMWMVGVIFTILFLFLGLPVISAIVSWVAWLFGLTIKADFGSWAWTSSEGARVAWLISLLVGALAGYFFGKEAA